MILCEQDSPSLYSQNHLEPPHVPGTVRKEFPLDSERFLNSRISRSLNPIWSHQLILIKPTEQKPSTQTSVLLIQYKDTEPRWRRGLVHLLSCTLCMYDDTRLLYGRLHTAKTRVTSSAPAADFLFSTALTSGFGIKSSSCVALLDDVSSCSNVKSLMGSSASREGGLCSWSTRFHVARGAVARRAQVKWLKADQNSAL